MTYASCMARPSMTLNTTSRQLAAFPCHPNKPSPPRSKRHAIYQDHANPHAHAANLDQRGQAGARTVSAKGTRAAEVGIGKTNDRGRTSSGPGYECGLRPVMARREARH